MKQSSVGMKLLTAVICLTVLLYFGIQAYRYYADPLATVVAYQYQAERSAAVSGWVIRNERVLEDSANGLLRISRGEGERVSANGEVAVVYADQASLERQEQIDALTAQVEQYEYAKTVEQGSEAILKLDNKIQTRILELRGAVAADKLDDASDGFIQDLRSLILKRDYTYTGTGDLEARLADLQSQIQALRAQSAASVRRITAPEAGLYSAVVDGYETVLTPAAVKDLTPSVLLSMHPNENAVSQIGKLVLGDSWYYAAIVAEADLEMLEEGDSVSLRFAKGVDQDLTVQVQSISQLENGKAVVVFQGDAYLSRLTLLRQQSADIVVESISGIRVPQSAIRVEEQTVTDKDGKTEQVQTSGVYCIISRRIRFKPVQVRYTGDGYMLVSAASSTERYRLREGDEIVVNPNGLYDGLTVS